MAGQRKKKYEAGEGGQYLSRAQAMKKLQLNLRDFRKLCILKGIYPREPRVRKRAQRGRAGIQTLYQKKDIQFLLHEPIIWKLRDSKVHHMRVVRARQFKKFGTVRHLMKKYPNMTLDHIVKERYPTFVDALRDLDDCLALCFLFAMFPTLPGVPKDQSFLCRRLTVEFMHACITARALRKVFVSIKGYYFQVELRGQTITWVMPHQFSFQPQSKKEVDFRIMSTFAQFYTVLLGFVNFRMYHTLNLYYPPTFAAYSASQAKDNELVDEEMYLSERIAALNQPLARSGTTDTSPEDEVELDPFPTSDDPEKIEEAKVEAEKLRKLKSLFSGMKVFLNREVPREALTFTLRCCGADVSWDKRLFVGATFEESDETITHQVVDRPAMDTQYISRYYVQPQWVFDCVNARELLPVEKYLIGCVLPPHLSPFIDLTRDEYNPQDMPDRSLLEGIEDGEVSENEEQNDDTMDVSTNDLSESGSEEDEDAEVEKEEAEDYEKDELRKAKRAGMIVSTGKAEKEDPVEKRKEEYQEYKLREKMINKKHRKLYRSMMKGRKDRARDKKVLMKKRRIIDENKSHKEQKQMVKS